MVTVANHRLITVIKFVAKSYTHPLKNFTNKFYLLLYACEILFLKNVRAIFIECQTRPKVNTSRALISSTRRSRVKKGMPNMFWLAKKILKVKTSFSKNIFWVSEFFLQTFRNFNFSKLFRVSFFFQRNGIVSLSTSSPYPVSSRQSFNEIMVSQKITSGITS